MKGAGYSDPTRSAVKVLGRKPEVLQSQEAETTEAATSAPDLGVFSHGYILLVKSPSLSPNRLMCQPGCPFLPRLSGACSRPGMQDTERQWDWNGVEGTGLSLPHHHQSVPAQSLSLWQHSPREERGASPRSLGSNVALLSTSPGVGQVGNTEE